MEKTSSSKRRHYDAAFRTEALCLASESRSTLAAVSALNASLYLRRLSGDVPLDFAAIIEETHVRHPQTTSPWTKLAYSPQLGLE